jgi:exodeoxyribonuclease-3
MDRLTSRAGHLLSLEEPVVLGGDYNVIPEDIDVWEPEGWRDDALFRMEVRAKFREILNLGYTESYRALHSQMGRYSFWDYQGGAWQKDNGIRIDHLLLSPQAADLLTACEIDKTPRAKPKPSDHTPVWCELSTGD